MAMGKSEIRRKYAAENAMFEIQPQKAERATDLGTVKRAAPWVWLLWALAAVIFRISGSL